MIKREDLQIHAAFHCREGLVEAVALSPLKAPFTWEVKGDLSLSEAIASWIEGYLAGREPKRSLPVNLSRLPPFTRRLLQLLQKVPQGSSLSYGELATVAGGSRFARAVGAALARNPCLLIIPCHRVLTAQKQIGGFSAGTDLKKRLLAFEKIPFGI